LNEIQITGIIKYREKYGRFKSIFELLAIKGFDQATVIKLQKFVRIDIDEKINLLRSLKNPSFH